MALTAIVQAGSAGSALAVMLEAVVAQLSDRRQRAAAYSGAHLERLASAVRSAQDREKFHLTVVGVVVTCFVQDHRRGCRFAAVVAVKDHQIVRLPAVAVVVVVVGSAQSHQKGH
jgi:hypothetical protein